MEDQLIQGEVFGPVIVDWDKLLGVILIASKDSPAEDSSPPHLKILNSVIQNQTDPPQRLIRVMSCPNLLARASSRLVARKLEQSTRSVHSFCRWRVERRCTKLVETSTGRNLGQ